MINCGWRTVLVEAKAKISIKDGLLSVSKENEESIIPINQIQTLMINDTKSSITVSAVAMLAREGVKVVFCDEKKNPNCEIIPYSCNIKSPSNLKTQFLWQEEKKQKVWMQIVRNKIQMQRSAIRKIDSKKAEKLKEYAEGVLPGDKSNREGLAAKIYFQALFGNSFRRRSESNINSALNYGYAILLSNLNRIICLYGYNTQIGINHHGTTNLFNFSYDLMEPFRPIIDLFVYNNKERELDYTYKQEIIAECYKPIQYGGKSVTVVDAMELYAGDIISTLNGKENKIKELKYA